MVKLNKCISFIVLSLLVAAGFFCSKNIEYPQLIWRSSTLYSEDLTNAGGTFEGKIYQDRIVTLGADGEDSYLLVAKSLETGKDLWKWQDTIPGTMAYRIAIPRSTYLYKNLFVMEIDGGVYVIDINTGKTVWKKDYSMEEGSWIGLAGLGKHVFFTGRKKNEGRPLYVFRANIETTALDTVYVVRSGNSSQGKKDLDLKSGSEHTYGLSLHIDEVGDTLVALGSQVAKGKERNTQYYLTVYNITQKKLVQSVCLSKTYLEKNSYLGHKTPIIYKGKVYLDMENMIVCVDLKTSMILWTWRSEYLSASFLYSGFIIADDKVIANCEDTWMYGLDANTGRELWREKSSGTSSEMLLMDGVVYFTGGEDRLFHAVDISTGKHLWKVTSPDLAHNSDAWFSREEPLVDENGRIYVRSYESLFCYELK